MNELTHLNEPQQEAVRSTEGALLILAGAGSGKTTVLIERCAQIIQNGTPPWRILAITFTNKAAGELKERLCRKLGPTGRDVWAHTFHAACIRFLRRDIGRLGYAPDFTIYDTADQKRIVRQALKQLNLEEKKFAPQAVLSLISKAKSEGLDAEGFRANAGKDPFALTVADCMKQYQKQLFDANALDFDDIIALTVRLFENHPEALAAWQEKFSYILVDEYQDTNLQQYKLCAMLAKSHGNLCVVGDDDQSIYRFRGATIENILNFERQYSDAKVIRLEQNYRSTGNILTAANAVIARNRGRKGKTLWTNNDPGEPVTRYEASDDNDEARFVAETILEGVKKGDAFRSYCVLYRMSAQSNRVEGTLRLSGIPYRIVGGTRFFDRAEIKDVMSYLQVIHNPSDDLRLLRVINVPARKLGDKTLQTVQMLAARDEKSNFQILTEAETHPELERTAHILKEFAEMILDLRDLSGQAELPDLYDELLRRSGYERMLMEKPEDEGKLENIRELRSNIVKYCEQEAMDATLAGFLDDTALFTDLDKLDADDDAVTLMTMHAAKGLEFPTVFMVGVEEDIFPSSRSKLDPYDVEEERRLCYVAATRARERLYVLNARERMLYGETRPFLPSRFLDEMGLEAPPESRSPYKQSRYSDELLPPISEDRAEIPSRSEPTGASAVKARNSANAFHAATARVRARPAPAAVKLSLKEGETVTHKKFGQGVVMAVSPMGGDALVEIDFVKEGRRRLMLNTAGAFITKHSD